MAEGFLQRNALWVALGAIALAGGIVAVGVQVKPETFYDHFWWEDIWGPLTVDAHQCRTDENCAGVTAPNGVRAKDGYTVTSELTYGAILATMLYGIYIGIFRKYGITADGKFVLALVPWIMLGPVARVLEDADVFCRAGTHCDPSPFAFLFISPVIYIHIALYVIAAMLLGVYLQRRADARRATATVAGILFVGVAIYAAIVGRWGDSFSALPPIWLVLLSAVAGAWFFRWRASKTGPSINLTIFTLGIPYAVGTLYLVAWWLTGHVWSDDAWSGRMYPLAGVVILTIALSTAGTVWLLARYLVKSGAERRLAALADKIPKNAPKVLGYSGLAAFSLFALGSGLIPALTLTLPNRETTLPGLALLGAVALAAYAFLEVSKGAAKRPGVLLIFAAGINLALVVGHVIDGVSTWIALSDPFNFGIPQYSEKHPFSEVLLRYWGGFLFPVAKLVMVLVVAWVLDREIKESPESLDERNLVGLVKMAIFVLGFAPGLRDLLRLAMGV